MRSLPSPVAPASGPPASSHDARPGTQPTVDSAGDTAGVSWINACRRAIRPARGPGWMAVGVVATAVLAAGVTAAQRPTRAPAASAAGHAATFWTAMTPLEDGRQMLLVVDPETRALALYHVDPAGGTVTLKSSRDISWDLLVGDFNAQEPRPAALKKMLEMPK
jgi:hypothetical protein